MISRADPKAEAEAIERIIHDIFHGEHDEEESRRIEEELRRISMPEILQEGIDAAA